MFHNSAATRTDLRGLGTCLVALVVVLVIVAGTECTECTQFAFVVRLRVRSSGTRTQRHGLPVITRL